MFLCIALFLQPALANETDTQIRDKIIHLIEDKLSDACSFTESSTHKVPHFEVLDQIFPKWHKGERATSRQFWVDARYLAFLVFYRVDYIYITSDISAVVKGKKLIYWTENKDTSKLKKLWPFQFWTDLIHRAPRDNNYLNASYTVRYGMKLSLNESEEWVIAEEKLYDNPNMVNNLRDHCSSEKQLSDWGLRSDCKK